MAENKIQLTKADRKKVCFRHQFLQGSWNYERMQNGGWCFAMIPAIKKLYTSKDDQIAALKRHLIFAGHKSAITFASQFTKTEHLRNPQDFGDLVRGLNVYGSKVIKGDALVPMVVSG